MAIGGLVLSLSPDPERRTAALAWIRAHPCLEVGPSEGVRLAVVATTETLGAGRDLCEALVELPGIDALEVAYIASEDDAKTLVGGHA